tara:strand:+ start:147 stop:314 length:168 start_codon:yes stop_codon:yes gene_type:complete
MEKKMIDDNTILEDITPKINYFGWLKKDLEEIQTLIEDINLEEDDWPYAWGFKVC